MKIKLTPLTGGKYAPYQEIKSLLENVAELDESDPLPREGGGGGWSAYGLNIALVASGMVAAGFLGKLGSDLYKKLKEKIKEYARKDPVFFTTSYENNKLRIITAFQLGEEGELKDNSYIGIAMNKLPKSIQEIGNFVEKDLLKHLPPSFTVVVCNFNKKDKNWFLKNIYTY